MTTDELINMIAELAQEVDKEDPIDFGMLQVDDESVWHLMASNVLDLYGDSLDNKLITLATITHLTVENFVLHAQLMQKNNTF
jgi:hypothetical protein